MLQAEFAQALSEFGPTAAPAQRPSLPEANAYCRRLAESHYENFTVVSRLLPRHLHQHFANVYAYCRWADDLADETGDAAESVRLLDWWESQLRDCYQKRGQAHFAPKAPQNEPVPVQPASHPVFVALTQTIHEFEIPEQPFLDLLSAFRQDQHVTRYETPTDVRDYCRRSANPVGRLVLAIGRVRDAESEQLSDEICTGLQLANFCQDVANDWDRGRVYLPQSTLREIGYTPDDFERRQFNDAFRRVMETEVTRAESHLNAGRPLIARMPLDLRFSIALFIGGGQAICTAIRQQDFDVWKSRPKLSKFDKLRIAARCWWQASFAR